MSRRRIRGRFQAAWLGSKTREIEHSKRLDANRSVSSSETGDDHLLYWPIAANRYGVIHEAMEMNKRFVVIPAIPIETGSVRNGTRFYCGTAPIGFNIYDNDEKSRSKAVYQTRSEAEGECQRLNLELVNAVLAQQQSKPVQRN